MKVVIFCKEFEDHVEAEWPSIPREGDIVTFRHSRGNENLRVISIKWVVDTNGNFEYVEINLSM